MTLAAEEAAKCKAAKDVIKSLTAQVRLLFFFLLSRKIDIKKLSFLLLFLKYV